MSITLTESSSWSQDHLQHAKPQSVAIFRDALIQNLKSAQLFTIDRSQGLLQINRDFVTLNNQFTYRLQKKSFCIDWGAIWKILSVVDSHLKDLYRSRFNLLKQKVKKIELGPFLLVQPIAALWQRSAVRIYQGSIKFSDLVAEVIDDILLEKILAGGNQEALRVVTQIDPPIDKMPKLGSKATSIFHTFMPLAVAAPQELPDDWIAKVLA